MDYFIAFIIGLVCVLSLYVLNRYLKRRKQATEAAMRCFAISESPAVKASRDVH